MKKKINKLICFIIGHQWHYLDALYEGEFDGKYCYRCDKEVGERYSPQKEREKISKAIDHDAITLGSVIRGLKQDILCIKGRHDWQSWSATGCGTVSQIEKMKENKEKLYSFRRCQHCFVEMPESRWYYNDNIKEKNALEYSESIFYEKEKKQ